ncbi:hypothetical protein CMO88_03895 [Candidatus Woesearchaeota archaeon]|nr:hypothetical protein [Candidatus Woesearchaeota archaeon]
MKKLSNNSLGSLSFIFGSLIAVITGLVSPAAASSTLTSLLILLGIIVGFLNITMKETNAFLLATVALVIVSALGGAVLGQVSFIGQYLESVLMSILTFVVPATVIVALKTIYSLAEK